MNRTPLRVYSHRPWRHKPLGAGEPRDPPGSWPPTRFQDAGKPEDASGITSNLLASLLFAGGDWGGGLGTYTSWLSPGSVSSVHESLRKDLLLAEHAYFGDGPGRSVLRYANAFVEDPPTPRLKVVADFEDDPMAVLDEALRWHARRMLNQRTENDDDATCIPWYGTNNLRDLAVSLGRDIDAVQGGDAASKRVAAYRRTLDLARIRAFAAGGPFDAP